MKGKLHRPKNGLWNLATLLFILGLVAYFVPIAGQFAFPLVVLSAALMLLGTWVI
jgi:hypothetical protein